MAANKYKKKKVKFNDYESSVSNEISKNDAYVRISKTIWDYMFGWKNENGTKLSDASKCLYITMRMSSCGKPEKQYALSIAKQDTGYSINTIRKSFEQLVEAGLVERIMGNKYIHVADTYKFSCKWYKNK